MTEALTRFRRDYTPPFLSYLAHEDERARIAAAGRTRTLRDHTYEIRIRELLGLLEART